MNEVEVDVKYWISKKLWRIKLWGRTYFTISFDEMVDEDQIRNKVAKVEHENNQSITNGT